LERALLTPADVHYGRSDEPFAARVGVLADAHSAHPERFVKGLPAPKEVPAKVWIDRPPKEVQLANLRSLVSHFG
jgi:hypothetical protein